MKRREEKFLGRDIRRVSDAFCHSGTVGRWNGTLEWLTRPPFRFHAACSGANESETCSVE